VTPLPGSMAFVLGAVLASTDPVAVTVLRRRLVLFRVAVAGAVTAAGVR
jgi:NhaP-type Na+/H+ or K+/H+ antiporter